MQSHVLTINGVAFSWSANIQRSIAKDSTDAEVKAVLHCVNRLVSLRIFLTSCSFNDLIKRPITLFIDSTACIKVIRSNKVSSRTRHLDVAVNYSHEYIQFGYFKPCHISNTLNLSDLGTKALSGPVLHRHWNTMRGKRFYPDKSDPHGQYIHDMSYSALADLNANKR